MEGGLLKGKSENIGVRGNEIESSLWGGAKRRVSSNIGFTRIRMQTQIPLLHM